MKRETIEHRTLALGRTGILAFMALAALQFTTSGATAAENSGGGAAVESEEPDFTDYLARRQLTLGGGAILAPRYEGSDEFRTRPVPFVSLSFGESIVVDPTGLQFTVFRDENLSFRLRAGYAPGRKEKDSDDLDGLGDIDAGAVIGGTASYQLGRVELYGTLEKTIGGAEGLQATLGSAVTHREGRFLFSAGGSATWADGTYMDAFFGVTPAQSARSGLSAYDPEAGLKRVDAEAFVTYLPSDHWIARAKVGVGYLLGDAADSPVVREEFQPSMLLMLGYRF